MFGFHTYIAKVLVYSHTFKSANLNSHLLGLHRMVSSIHAHRSRFKFIGFHLFMHIEIAIGCRMRRILNRCSSGTLLPLDLLLQIIINHKLMKKQRANLHTHTIIGLVISGGITPAQTCIRKVFLLKGLNYLKLKLRHPNFIHPDCVMALAMLIESDGWDGSEEPNCRQVIQFILFKYTRSRRCRRLCWGHTKIENRTR